MLCVQEADEGLLRHLHVQRVRHGVVQLVGNLLDARPAHVLRRPRTPPLRLLNRRTCFNLFPEVILNIKTFQEVFQTNFIQCL